MQKNKLNSVLLIIAICLFSQAFGSNSERISRVKYIDSWKEVAINNMVEFKIPASITLAQGILESGDGNSELAKMSNNHFGIKCHGWQGAKVYYDDDAKGECFRKYDNAGASFADHSEFLLRKRYNSLFELDIDDYKSWARGLKKCGYATDPAYAKLLISLIEKNRLYEYDLIGMEKIKNGPAPKDEPLVENSDSETKTSETKIPKTISLAKSRDVVLSKNNIKYVLAAEEDTLEKIAGDLGLPVFLIKKYNDKSKSESKLTLGEVVYIQPKRKKYKHNSFHIVKEGQSMKQISQMYGVKLKVLYKKNNMKFGTEPETGMKLSLRQKMVS